MVWNGGSSSIFSMPSPPVRRRNRCSAVIWACFSGICGPRRAPTSGIAWTPRLARAFQQHLRQTLTPEGRRAWSDKTIRRILAHLKTFATWVHTHQPFPLGPPMAAIKLPALGTGLEVDRALTAAERRRLLDAADLLLTMGGRSKDRKRYKTGERPRRTGYRPYRNRAIVYTFESMEKLGISDKLRSLNLSQFVAR